MPINPATGEFKFIAGVDCNLDTSQKIQESAKARETFYPRCVQYIRSVSEQVGTAILQMPCNCPFLDEENSIIGSMAHERLLGNALNPWLSKTQIRLDTFKIIEDHFIYKPSASIRSFLQKDEIGQNSNRYSYPPAATLNKMERIEGFWMLLMPITEEELSFFTGDSRKRVGLVRDIGALNRYFISGNGNFAELVKMYADAEESMQEKVFHSFMMALKPHKDKQGKFYPSRAASLMIQGIEWWVSLKNELLVQESSSN